MRRFSEASAMVAPPVQDFDGAFQTMVTWTGRSEAAGDELLGPLDEPGWCER